MKGKLNDLEASKTELEANLDDMGDEEPLRIHPGLSAVYRRKVAELTDALNADGTRAEAIDLLRGLITEIRMTPEIKGHAIELVGELVAIMARGDQTKKKPQAMGLGAGSLTVVAGVGFEPTTFRL